MKAGLVIDRRYCGPPGLANGGYAAGLVAEELGAGAIEVTLRRPIPLGVRLCVEAGAETLNLVLEGQGVLAEARHVDLSACRPPVVPWPDVLAAEGQPYAGAEGFGGCFACGPEVPRGQSLGVFPRLLREVVVGCPWRPPAWAADRQGRIPQRFVWAALDCSGGFALELAGPAESVVTGRLVVEVLRAPRSGEPCAVLGWQSGSEGRKRFVRSAVLSQEGELLAHGAAVWLEVKQFQG